MYSQPKTGVSFLVYVGFAIVAGFIWLGRKIRAYGAKLINKS